MNRSTSTGRQANRTAPATLAVGAFAVLLLSGCGAPATFVSPAPPPDMAAEAWYQSSVPAVRTALESAMRRSKIAVDPTAGRADTVVGTKQQVPYVGRAAGEPTSGPLPVYRIATSITRPGNVTHVRASVVVACPACNGRTPYEWEYPVDLLRNVFEKTRDILEDGGARMSYPPRHKPDRWRRPRKY